MFRKYFVLQPPNWRGNMPALSRKGLFGECGRHIDLSQEARRQMKRAAIGVAVVCFVVFCSTTIWAQGTAQISGTAKDQSGAVLPGVEITVTQTDTGIARSTVSNETGSYALPNLPVGPYRLEASLPGFRTYVQTGIVLQVN